MISSCRSSNEKSTQDELHVLVPPLVFQGKQTCFLAGKSLQHFLTPTNTAVPQCEESAEIPILSGPQAMAEHFPIWSDVYVYNNCLLSRNDLCSCSMIINPENCLIFMRIFLPSPCTPLKTVLCWSYCYVTMWLHRMKIRLHIHQTPCINRKKSMFLVVRRQQAIKNWKKNLYVVSSRQNWDQQYHKKNWWSWLAIKVLTAG